MTAAETTSIVIPAEIVQSIGKAGQELKIELAIYFYKEFQLSSAQAARFADIPRSTFWHELGKRKIPVNYDKQDALHDIESIRRFTETFPI